MNRLFLLRHAKAAWAAPGMADFDRPLDATGERDCATMGAALARRALRPSLVLCSKAVRTVQTWERVGAVLGQAETVHDARIYSADASALRDIIAEQEISGDLMVVGHNPTIEDLALAFGERAERAARTAIESGFPTCGFAVIELDSTFAEIAPGGGRLVLSLTPSNL